MTPSPSPAIDSANGKQLPSRAMLIVLLAGASLAFSMAFACATPFAALATVSALRMTRRDALAAVTIAWLVNQADGYLFMHYPQTWESFGWGAAIGLSAIAGTLAASEVARRTPHWFLACVLAFTAAFVTYEGLLEAATVVLPSSSTAISPGVVARLLAINVMAVVALFALTSLLKAIGASLHGGVSTRISLAHGRKSAATK